METEKEDGQLIGRFLSGDGQGFDLLVKKYQGYVLNIVYSLTGNSQFADDIAQDVFIKVYKNLSSFKKEAKFSTWLYRITVNTAYNYLKSRKRYVSLEIVPEALTVGKVSTDDLEGKERQEIIRSAIEKLPFKYRTVIVLKEIEGLSYEDIAATLGCRIGTVESRLFRARAMLKKILYPILTKEDER